MLIPWKGVACAAPAIIRLNAAPNTTFVVFISDLLFSASAKKYNNSLVRMYHRGSSPLARVNYSLFAASDVKVLLEKGYANVRGRI
jgi:hypothetical protein